MQWQKQGQKEKQWSTNTTYTKPKD